MGQYTTKWFGHELGAQSTYTNKESQGERAIVNGHHDPPIFQTMLDKFIDKYVLCENCRLPEIDMSVKRGLIVAKCKACGWAGGLDNGHRLAAFIVRNPPDESGHGLKTPGGEGEKVDKATRRLQKQAKQDAVENGEDDEDKPLKKKKEKKYKDNGEDDGDVEKEKKKKKKKDKTKDRDLDDEEGDA